MPSAFEVQSNEPLIARQQQITYRLPPDISLYDVFVHLERSGWSRDQHAEQMLRHDQMDKISSKIFTRQRLLGMLSEIALVKGSLTDSNSVEIQIIRCFRLFSPNQCL